MDQPATPAPAQPAVSQDIRPDPRVYLAMPAFGGKIDSPFAQSMLNLMQIPGIVGSLEFLNGDSLVSRARNKLARFFLEGRPGIDEKGVQYTALYEWMLFIDTDLVFNPNEIVSLLNYAREHGPGVYCGAYPLKTIKPKVVFNPMPGATLDKDGVIEVRESGTGMMLIHREVLVKMRDFFRMEIEYEADAGNLAVSRQLEWDFFSVGVRYDPILKYKRYLSEDWYFCQRWREMGGKVFLHTRIQAQHIGQIHYPVPMKDIMETAEMYKDAKENARRMGEEMERAKQQDEAKKLAEAAA